MTDQKRIMRVYVHSGRGLDIEKHKIDFDSGLVADPAPYGFNLAEDQGVIVTYSRDQPFSKFSLLLFQRLNFDIFHALHNLTAIRQADVVWTMLEREWMAVAFLQRLWLAPKRPIIANSVWLAHFWMLHAPIKRMLYRWLMMPHLDLTLHSNRALNLLADYIPEQKFRLSHFGISTNAWPLTAPKLNDWSGRIIKVYSIGNDVSRDWKTMLEAFGNDPRFHVTIVCKWLDKSLSKEFSNVESPAALTIKEQLYLYAHSDIVVMPMFENSYSGITVLLEAATLGKPIVASRTGGAETYFSEDEVTYVSPGNPTALRQAVLSRSPEHFFHQAERAQARFRACDYTSASMVGRYIKSSVESIGDTPI